MPILAKPIPQEVVEYARTKLAAQFFHEDAAACWPFPYRPQANGYPYFKIGGVVYSATRVAVLLDGRDLPADKVVCHHCDFPRCVNPEHLIAETREFNARDAAAKGRLGKTRRVWVNSGKVCKKCGHHRTDDYPARKGTPARCRQCHNNSNNLRRARLRQQAALSGKAA